MSTLITDNVNTGTIKDSTGTTTAATIDSGGRIFQPTKPFIQLLRDVDGDYAENATIDGFTAPASDNIVGDTTNSTWRKVTSVPFADRGSNMTVDNSNGRFTFPHAGVFRVMCQLNLIGDEATDNNVQNEIDYSTDSGSNFSNIGVQVRGGNYRSSGGYTLVNEAIFNVTNASTFRLRINLGSATGTTCTGGGDDDFIYSKIIFEQI